MLVGINLLREGLDLPEVSLVAILDADKEGFLRSQTSLIQTIGRAARNVNGRVLLYADKITDSMQSAIDETNRRRESAARLQRGARASRRQTIHKGVSDIVELLALEDPKVPGRKRRGQRKVEGMSSAELEKLVVTLEEEMYAAAEELRFEYAAKLRDEVKELRRELQADARPRRRRSRCYRPSEGPGWASVTGQADLGRDVSGNGGEAAVIGRGGARRAPVTGGPRVAVGAGISSGPLCEVHARKRGLRPLPVRNQPSAVSD